MSVIAANEIHRGRQGEGTVNRLQSIRKWQRVWIVRTNDQTDGGDTVTAAIPIVYGDPHPNDPYAWCNSVNAKCRDDSKLAWIVTYGYTTEREYQENPLNDPAEIEWDTQQYTRPYFQDNTGNAILNAAGYYYEKPCEGDDSRWMVNIKKNMASVPSWILQYNNAINSDAFMVDGIGVAAYCAKMARISIGIRQQRNNVFFRVLQLSMHISTNSWVKQLLEEGTYCIGADLSDSGDLVSKLVPCYDSHKMPVKTPVPLDQDGTQLQNPTPQNAVFTPWHIYPELSFGALPLT